MRDMTKLKKDDKGDGQMRKLVWTPQHGRDGIYWTLDCKEEGLQHVNVPKL